MEEGGSLPVAAWLAALHLDQYVESFQQSELWTVWDCRALTDEALTRLGVVLPGHRRRILLGLQKAFAEATLPAGTPLPPARKPVPMKRHIFRRSTATVPEQPEQPEPRCPAVPGGSPLLEPEGGASFAQLPPPIPPRVGCRPPLKFSPSLTGGSPEPLPAPRSRPPAPEVPSSPTLTDKPPAESRVKPPLPPLPAKRHQLEAKCPSLTAPPLPTRPPVLPPRAVTQRSISAKEEVPVPDPAPGSPPAPPALLPRTKPPPAPLPPELPSKANVPFVPEFDDSDYEDSAWEEELARPAGEMATKGKCQ
ncbi:arf-GAP with Rho-GAP domain, ANK repeat and PH domain-containing protein 1 [Phoenicopterus ruber ruber]